MPSRHDTRNGGGEVDPAAIAEAVEAASGQVPEVDATGADLGTKATVRVVKDAGGSFIETETSDGEKVS